VNRRVMIGIVVAIVVIAFAATMFTINNQVAEANRDLVEQNAPATASENEPSDPPDDGQGAASTSEPTAPSN
jgi:hypothetical protein